MGGVWGGGSHTKPPPWTPPPTTQPPLKWSPSFPTPPASAPQAHSGIDTYDLTVGLSGTSVVLWASTHPPRVPHGRLCEVLGDCPTGATAEHLVVPVAGALPEGVALTGSATARNRAGLNGIAPTADFELDSTPPLAAVPQALLFQPQAEYVSLALLWDVYQDLECLEGADRGILILFSFRNVSDSSACSSKGSRNSPAVGPNPIYIE